MSPEDSTRAGVGRPTLARLVLDPDAFAARVWGTAPWFSDGVEAGEAGDPRTFTDLLDADGIDELIATRGLRTPFLRVAKNGKTLGAAEFTAGGGVGAAVADQVSDDKLHRLFAQGASIVLQGLHRLWPPIVDFCQDLAEDLGHPVQCNAYITPPQNQGFSAHYDVHDVFVLQVEGEKHWRIHEPVFASPLRDQTFDTRLPAVQGRALETPVLEVTLRPGDCLYLPRGYLHSATAAGAVSVHLTIGVHTWTRSALADAVVSAAVAHLIADPARTDLRESLPVGCDVTSALESAEHLPHLKEALITAIGSVTPEAVAETLRPTVRGSMRAEPLRPIAQAAAAREVAASTVVRRRRHLSLEVTRLATGEVRLRGRNGLLVVAADQAPGLDQVLDGGPVTAGDLPLPAPASLDLIRRLLDTGVVLPD